MANVFHPPVEPSFAKVGIEGRIFDTQALGGQVQFNVISTERGHETRIVENECDFTYYILEGSGRFEIGGETEDCSRGDLVVVPRGTPFQYAGKMKMLLAINPWWFPEQEEAL